jgi:uncharacterized lipoprotein NlpE involved in copper resistance
MKLLQRITVAFVIIVGLSLCGCDYMRRGGAYRLTFDSQATEKTTANIQAQNGKVVRPILERWLSDRGFQEFKYNESRAVWQKGGARVYLTLKAENEVLAEIGRWATNATFVCRKKPSGNC